MKQCKCCASPLGEEVTIHGATEVVCNKCLGFITRWVASMKTQSTLIPAPPQPKEPEF